MEAAAVEVLGKRLACLLYGFCQLPVGPHAQHPRENVAGMMAAPMGGGGWIKTSSTAMRAFHNWMYWAFASARAC